MKHPHDEDAALPVFHRAWEPAPPRERKPVPTKRPANFRDPHAPHIDTRKRRRAVIQAALESIVANEKTDPIERREARKLLHDLNRIARERPDTTMMGMVPVGAGRMSIWVFEPDLAPVGKTPERVLKRNAAINRAFQALRSI